MMNEKKNHENIEHFNDVCWSIINVYGDYAKSIGLTYISYSVLECIYNADEPCTQKQIAEKTYLPKQSVNATVTSFLKDGYIELKEVPTDRRNKTIQFTVAGQEYAENVMLRITKAEEAVIEEIDPKQLNLMIETLRHYEKTIRKQMNITSTEE